jgi:large subunit ribosomal protein L6
MSRVGKKIITIPQNVTVSLQNENLIVNGPHGKLEQKIISSIDLSLTEHEIKVSRKDETKFSKACHGLFQVLIQNMIKGVSQKFSKNLVVEGVGYKFQSEKGNLILNMGFSHRVQLVIPEDLVINLESPTKMIVSGINKEKVGFFAAKVRNIKPPEPYKGKGIRYEDEKILRKAGKTGK